MSSCTYCYFLVVHYLMLTTHCSKDSILHAQNTLAIIGLVVNKIEHMYVIT